MEPRRVELLTSWMQIRRSTNWAKAPFWKTKINCNILLSTFRKLVGRGGLEPPTSRLSGVRSNQLSYRPRQAAGLKLIIEEIWGRLGPGPSKMGWCFDMQRTYHAKWSTSKTEVLLLRSSLERRWSSRRFPYGYLVTTSPQSLILPWPPASPKG